MKDWRRGGRRWEVRVGEGESGKERRGGEELVTEVVDEQFFWKGMRRAWCVGRVVER